MLFRRASSAAQPHAESRRPGDTFPLSVNQEQYLMARDVRARRGASSGAFNVVDCMRVRGPLNVPVFEAALNEVIQRHSTLRAIVRPNPSWPSTVRRQAVDAFERSGMFDSGMYEQSVLPRFRLTIPYRQLDT